MSSSDTASVKLELARPTVTVQSMASQKLRTSLRYLASRLGHNQLPEIDTIFSLASVLNSSKKII